MSLPAIVRSDAVDLIGMWRNQALDKGIRLSQATTDEERRAIEGEIEREAMAVAALLLDAGTSRPSSVSLRSGVRTARAPAPEIWIARAAPVG